MEKLPLFAYGILKPEISGLIYEEDDLVGGKYTSVYGYFLHVHNIAYAYKHRRGIVHGYLWFVSRLGDEEYRQLFFRLDALESAYNREVVETVDGERAWMYVAKHVPQYPSAFSVWPPEQYDPLLGYSLALEGYYQ